MAGRQLVLWFDNFVRPHYTHNPVRQGRMHLNATAVAVLDVGRTLPVCDGLPPLPQLFVRGRNAVRDVCHYQWDFMDLWRQVLVVDLTERDFRVPLDLLRESVQRSSWWPLAVSDRSVQNNDSLVELLEMCEVVRTQTGRPTMPLLVDINLWYRMVKMVYARNMQRWDVRHFLKGLPVLYGVWHPYKYTISMVYRQFFAFFVFLREGTVPVTWKGSSKVDIRAVELFLAALLTVPRAKRQALQHTIGRAAVLMERSAEKIVTLERKVTAAKSALAQATGRYDRVMRGDRRRTRHFAPYPSRQQRQSEDARLSTLENELQLQYEDLQRKKDEKNRLVALSFLLEQYAPACLCLGVLMRDCTWKHLGPDSGVNAKTVFMAALVMLLHLCERPHLVEYVRSLSIALTMWRSWNEACPGKCYSEERCEALLSRLGARCRSYPSFVTAEGVEDLFLGLVDPPAEDLVLLRSHRPTRELVDAVHRNLDVVIRTGAQAITCVPWTDTGLVFATGEWPANAFLPRSLSDALDPGELQDMFNYHRRVVLSGNVAVTELAKEQLDRFVGSLSLRATQIREQAIESELARLPLPDRYRQRTSRGHG